PLGVIDAPVQSHVETEGEQAHGVESTKSAPRAQCPLPGGPPVGYRRAETRCGWRLQVVAVIAEDGDGGTGGALDPRRWLEVRLSAVCTRRRHTRRRTRLGDRWCRCGSRSPNLPKRSGRYR